VDVNVESVSHPYLNEQVSDISLSVVAMAVRWGYQGRNKENRQISKADAH